ncbi:unknown [Spodoptera litura nucleopolyhedrovirus II]|uniref:hypothetical protein n=1 Tax=Spodoptera litura nucleopolyhedrovirus II TaxID=566270 RepID=UPI00018745D0|nr:hypothetical protein SlnV2_gp033 [Spodoptera litura nucleopolyhedrovirus II]ACI47402.1 unknown [Spodoptera litura nucleopolyhedrovirus II]
MRIALYTLALTSVGRRDDDAVEELLDKYFCPIFVVHGIIDTLAVCEDTVCVDGDASPVYKNYEDFLRTPQSDDYAVTIQEVGDIDQKVAMIEKIINIVNENNGAIVLADYY